MVGFEPEIETALQLWLSSWGPINPIKHPMLPPHPNSWTAIGFCVMDIGHGHPLTNGVDFEGALSY